VHGGLRVKKRSRTQAVFLVAGDVISVGIAIGIGVVLAGRLGQRIQLPFLGLGSRVVTPSVAVAWLGALSVFGTRDPRLVPSGSEFYVRTIRATVVAFGSMALIGFAADVRAMRPFILFSLPTGLITLVLWRRAARSLARGGVIKGRDARLALVVGTCSQAEVLWLDDIGSLPMQRRLVAGGCSVAQIMDQVASAGATDLILVAGNGLGTDELRELAWRLDECRVSFWMEGATHFLRPGRAIMFPGRDATLLAIETAHLTPIQSFVKRSFDVVVASLLSVLAAPIVLVSSVLVLLTDGWPIFHRQVRIGEGGEHITISKIRTMRSSSDCVSTSITTGRKPIDDPRVFRIGRVLRRWSIDELPQLVNVLGGSMSLVGPRPRLPEEETSSSYAGRRLRARPGLTGLWQTSGRANLPLAEAEVLDAFYVDTWSLTGDVVLLLRTIRVILSGEGAY
jgi:lipopolysaccharide/colanic/teichoic acid biosynthesis glycosyltransferase